MTYKAILCSCRYPTCWFVEPVAGIRGVSYTEAQARLVAAVLNTVEFNTAPVTPKQKMINQCVAYIINAAMAEARHDTTPTAIV